MVKDEKLSKIVLQFIPNHLRFALFDCSDSMHDEEKYLAKFEGACDDKINIKKYIEKYHLIDYANSLKEEVKNAGEEINDWEEYLNNTCSSLYFSYKKLKKLL